MTKEIVLLDEINFQLNGFPQDVVQMLVEETKIYDKALRYTAAVKMGIHDGKVPMLTEDGFGFQFLLDQIIDLLLAKGVEVDDIELIDQRLSDPSIDLDPEMVGDDYVYDEFGLEYRHEQKLAVQEVIKRRQGIVDAGTGFGKTITTYSISKVFEPYFKSLVVVPSDYLVRQTGEVYEQAGANWIALGDVKPKKREEVIKQYDHFIITYKLLLNVAKFFENQQLTLIGDEIHDFGEKTADAFRFELRNAPVRVGLTATVPKDKLKATRIMAHLGGDRLIKVKAADMVKKGYVLDPDIQVVTTSHEEVEELAQDKQSWDWEAEFGYFLNHDGRLDAIAEFIKSLPQKNTLILCHPQAGRYICQHFGGRFINEEVKREDREAWLREFDDHEDYVLTASFETTSKGISVNTIRRVIMLDVGPTEKYFLQGIGRGMRLDGDAKEFDVVDISANTPHAKRHRKGRLKVYKQEKYRYTEIDEKIIVE